MTAIVAPHTWPGSWSWCHGSLFGRRALRRLTGLRALSAPHARGIRFPVGWRRISWHWPGPGRFPPATWCSAASAITNSSRGLRSASTTRCLASFTSHLHGGSTAPGGQDGVPYARVPAGLDRRRGQPAVRAHPRGRPATAGSPTRTPSAATPGPASPGSPSRRQRSFRSPGRSSALAAAAFTTTGSTRASASKTSSAARAAIDYVVGKDFLDWDATTRRCDIKRALYEREAGRAATRSAS
jgi:hypothetical protein